MIFLIFFISFFSVIAGIILKVIIGDYGALFAFAVFSLLFRFDYITTISVKNVSQHETNKMFGVFSKYFGVKMSLFFVGCVYITIQLVVYYVTGDLIITYILIVLHGIVACMNIRVIKSLSKVNDIVQ